MHVGGTPPATGHDPLREQADDLVEVLALESRKGRCTTNQREEFVLVPVFGAAGRHDLLGENVEGRLRWVDRIEVSRTHSAQERGAFHEFVPRHGEETPRGRAAPGMPRAPHALNKGGETARRTDLAHPFHRADVDPEFQGSGCHQGAEFARTQLGLHAQAALPGKTPVMGRNPAIAQLLAELVRQPLRHAAGVDEDQRRPVSAHLSRDLLQHIVHLLRRSDCLHLAFREFQAQIEGTAMPDIHDLTAWSAILPRALRSGAHQEARHRLDGALGGREPDADRALTTQGVEALQRKGEMRAPLVPRHRVDLIHDDGPHTAQDFAAALGGQHQVERLRRGDQQMGGLFQHGGPLRGRGVPGSKRHPQFRKRRTEFACDLANFRQRAL